MHSNLTDEDSGETTAEPRAARSSPRSAAPPKKRGRSRTPRPPQLEGVFSPVEIDFFERAADLYADDYDVWEDFRPAEVN